MARVRARSGAPADGVAAARGGRLRGGFCGGRNRRPKAVRARFPTMSKIDDELAKAVEDSEADEAARPVVMQGASVPQAKPRRELVLLGTLLAVGAAILTLVM